MKVKEVEIFAEYPSGSRFKPVGISLSRGFVLQEIQSDSGGENENAIVRFGQIALVMVEGKKETYITFKL